MVRDDRTGRILWAEDAGKTCAYQLKGIDSKSQKVENENTGDQHHGGIQFQQREGREE
jgi:hypothetical protein